MVLVQLAHHKIKNHSQDEFDKKNKTDGLTGPSQDEFGGAVDAKQQSTLIRYTRWPYLTAVAALIAWLLTHLLPSLHMPGAWILVDFAVFFIFIARSLFLK